MSKIFTVSGRADVYARVTSEIIAAIESGPGERRLPWHHDGKSTARPINVVSSKCYRGINRLVLWAAAMSASYTSGVWGTYRAWQAAGAQVRKGEKSTTVVLWKETGSQAEDHGNDDETKRPRMFARAFSVFNELQVDGYCSDAIAAPNLPENERLLHAERFLANLCIKTNFGGSEAFYIPATDQVHMPSFERFRDPASFLASGPMNVATRLETSPAWIVI
jgi:antirestriction protein ArdC